MSSTNAIHDPSAPEPIREPTRAGRPDGQFVDEIRIITVPRWKESELSGDEWRISACIEFYRKGQLVGSRSTRDIETAARFADWFLCSGREDGGIEAAKIDGLCDQEGCSRPWTTKLRLKQRYSSEGHIRRSFGVEYRCFCDSHKIRGDCGLDDADANYETD